MSSSSKISSGEDQIVQMDIDDEARFFELQQECHALMEAQGFYNVFIQHTVAKTAEGIDFDEATKEAVQKIDGVSAGQIEKRNEAKRRNEKDINVEMRNYKNEMQKEAPKPAENDFIGKLVDLALNGNGTNCVVYAMRRMDGILSQKMDKGVEDATETDDSDDFEASEASNASKISSE